MGTELPDRSVLMIAYHFPPLAGSSGIQRTLRFVQQLPALGWQPLVLTALPHAYERVSEDLLRDVPGQTPVRRAFALDAARHLSLGGRYFGATARPDRWISWQYDGVRQGMKLIKEFRPRAIWSTFPIPTAHLIAAQLQQRSGLPWVADFRDPMAQDGYPTDPKLWAAFDQLERRTIEMASASIFTTPGAARIYQQRYPSRAGRIGVLENGYDEESFAQAERSNPEPRPLMPGLLTLLHSGIVYPAERDPTQLMGALQRLKVAGLVSAADFRVRFRASVHDELLLSLARQYQVTDLIETLPPLDYSQALQEMRCADALLVMQSSGCNEQIPAKVYEYLRAKRPIICLSDPAGDTAGVLRDAGLSAIAGLDDIDDIERTLGQFLQTVRAGQAALPNPQAVKRASRQGRSGDLAALLNQLTGGRPPGFPIASG